MVFSEKIKVSNFKDSNIILNGIYSLVTVESMPFNEKKAIYNKEDINLSLWNDFNGKMFGGRFFDKENSIKTYAWYDRGRWCGKEEKWKGYWLEISEKKRSYDIEIVNF
jgi:hypothetical protein